MGIKIPVALTRQVYEKCVALPEGYKGFQDTTGRLADIFVCVLAVIANCSDSNKARFSLCTQVIKGDTDDVCQDVHQLYLVVEPGDNLEPVMTILFTHED